MTVAFWFAYYIAAILYLSLHMAVYVIFLRKVPSFAKEKWIFLYHLVSVCVLCVMAFTSVLNDLTGTGTAAATSVVFAHGIYSLSFLELWSLSQISYSREILALAARQDGLAMFPPPVELVRIGDRKKAGRLNSLLHLKLIRRDGNTIHLTMQGRVVAWTLRSVSWFANLKHTG